MNEQNELKDLQDMLCRLDMALTGHSEKDCQSTSNYYFGKDRMIVDWLADETYYLSDGGYSRVFFRESSDGISPPTIQLTSNSLEHVKLAWNWRPDVRIIKEQLNKWAAFVWRSIMEEQS